MTIIRYLPCALTSLPSIQKAIYIGKFLSQLRKNHQTLHTQNVLPEIIFWIGPFSDFVPNLCAWNTGIPAAWVRRCTYWFFNMRAQGLDFFPRIYSFFANDSSWLIFGFACVGYLQEWVECYTRRWDGIWLIHKPFQQKSPFFFSSVWKINTACIGLICVRNCPNELPRFPCVFKFPHSFPLTN